MSSENCISYTKLCGIVCCPPFPSSWVSKLAFFPPAIKTYELIPTQTNSNRFALYLSPEFCHASLYQLIQQDARFMQTSKGSIIAVVFIKCTENKNYTILYSHNNANDIGSVFDFCIDLSLKTGCDVVTYDYSGYGRSTGKPSEKNIYADIKAAWDCILAFYEPNPQKIILFGESIGTVPTIDLASKVRCGGVIVQSPIMSALRFVCPNDNNCRFFDCMNSVRKVRKVTAPVLVVHGTEDDLVDFTHGETIYKNCPRAVEPLWLEGVGHHDIELDEEYVDRLLKFMHEDIAS
ncbi:alpha/beta hydrolase domain-containing protein 17C [Parasteatoda tepidariorum]|uniref:alpha/beta hydrolase domain-containing protein 17C n=1 Tax=Parasteatoda tepidariorum TaxID=114398 RepID=UPI00077FD49C|nr:alpha/beta hydrolase domain-containing protein 17C [Parasteatoda tepidariorum]